VRFDAALRAWILSTHADVSAALREPRLALAGTDTGADAAHLAVREAGREALAPARLALWWAELEPLARALAARLPAGPAVDLVHAFAEPWSLALAVAATGASAKDAERLAALAREVFLAAACATDSEPVPRAQAAAAELARSLTGAGASVAVQSFVALSQTLPCFLASAWLELFRDPQASLRLRAEADLMPQAIEELLRHASPARALFRQALAEVSIGRARIGAGARVILLLSAANHDPAQFTDPGRLDFQREAARHLAFGGGAHSCVGAPLIRAAAALATTALLGATSAVESIGPVDWIGGFAIRAPGTLPVVLRRALSGASPA